MTSHGLLPPTIAYAALVCVMSFNVAMCFLNWRSWCRQVKLSLLLQDLCFRAWRDQHIPAWHAWSEMTGIGFEIRPRFREEQE